MCSFERLSLPHYLSASTLDPCLSVTEDELKGKKLEELLPFGGMSDWRAKKCHNRPCCFLCESPFFLPGFPCIFFADFDEEDEEEEDEEEEDEDEPAGVTRQCTVHTVSFGYCVW